MTIILSSLGNRRQVQMLPPADYANMLDLVRQLVRANLPTYYVMAARTLGLTPSAASDLATIVDASRRFRIARQTIYYMLEHHIITRYAGSCISQAQLVTHVRTHAKRFKGVDWAAVEAYDCGAVLDSVPSQVTAQALERILDEEMEAADLPNLPTPIRPNADALGDDT